MKSIKTAALVVGLFAWGLGLSAAKAEAQQAPQQIIKSLTCGQIQQILTSMNLPSECQTDVQGDPFLWSKSGDIVFGIITHGCDRNREPRPCQAMQFFATWEGQANTNQLAAALSFNGQTLLGRSYINQQRELFVDMPLVIAGVTILNVQQHIYYWQQAILPEFVRNVISVGGKPNGPDEEIASGTVEDLETVVRALSQDQSRKGVIGSIPQRRANPMPGLPQ